MASLKYEAVVNVDSAKSQAVITLINISAEGLVLFLSKRGWYISEHSLDDDCNDNLYVVISITSKYPFLKEKLGQLVAQFIRLHRDK